MRLSCYIDEHWKTRTAFAAAIGVTRQALSRYEAGTRRPEWDILERIVAVSGGKVTPNDFLDTRPGIEPAGVEPGSAAGAILPAPAASSHPHDSEVTA